MRTPITQNGLKKYDLLSPVDAVIKAWTNPGSNEWWHANAKHDVRQSMPLLARALDRLAKEKR